MLLSSTRDFRFALDEHKPEALRARAGEIRQRMEALPSDAAERAGMEARAARFDAMADRPPMWLLRRPNTRQRLRYATRVDERERDMGARQGREVVRSAIDEVMWDMLTTCVIGAENIPNDDGSTQSYSVSLGPESKELFWDRVPLHWLNELANALMQSFMLRDDDSKNC